eukprot:9692486-Alexandrium_andersonii.AAC.1
MPSKRPADHDVAEVGVGLDAGNVQAPVLLQVLLWHTTQHDADPDAVAHGILALVLVIVQLLLEGAQPATRVARKVECHEPLGHAEPPASCRRLVPSPGTSPRKVAVALGDGHQD